MHKLPFIRHLAAISCGVVNGKNLNFELQVNYSGIKLQNISRKIIINQVALDN
jgi:hypothetical protein